MDTALSLPLVLVLDDDRSVRRSLERLIGSAGFEVRTFSSVPELLESGLAMQASCLVVDVWLPGRSGLDLQETLVAAGASAPIIFISGHADVPMSVRAMRAGAVNFLQKPLDEATLLGAVAEAVERGRKSWREQVWRDRIARQIETLTPREREVFNLVVGGLPNKKIAGQLGASEKTVKVHRGRVMTKMHAGSLADLVHMAHEGGLTAAPAGTEAPSTWVPAATTGTVGPASDSVLVGASEAFANHASGPGLDPRAGASWRWSRARRSSPSSGSSG